MKSKVRKKILILGAGGYIGSRLTRLCLEAGFNVCALDRYFFGMEVFKELLPNERLEIVRADTRNLNPQFFEGVYAVLDLAAMSNDPSGSLNKSLTKQINYEARIRNARLASNCGVAKYILSSSCAVYGSTGGRQVDESSRTSPLTEYACSSLLAEQGIIELVSSNECGMKVTIFRNGTVFGVSKRMRFDLVLNLMVLDAFTKGSISILGGGNQWRPLVHIDDVVDCFIRVVCSDSSDYDGEIINLGLANFQIRTIAHQVKSRIGNHININEVRDDADARDYIVSFEKAHRLGFAFKRNLIQGVDDVYGALLNGSTQWGEKTVTVKWYQRLMEAENLFDTLSIEGKIL